jgi:Aspartyl protease
LSHFTRQIEADGPTLNAVVTVSAARATALKDASVPLPQPVPIRALVDTGASCTCVDPDVLARLQLTPTGKASLNTPSTGGQAQEFDQYDIGLAIPGAAPGAIPLFLGTVPVVAAVLTGQAIQALIGRDILGACVLVYNGTTGLFTLAY